MKGCLEEFAVLRIVDGQLQTVLTPSAEINQQVGAEKPVTRKEKVLGVIRLTRPQFITAYAVVGVSGIVFGLNQGKELPNASSPFLAFLPIIIAAMGVHFRDEASDWIAGYDKEHGGMGVIRDGLFEDKIIRNWGVLLTILAILIGILQAVAAPILFIIGIPMCLVILFANYLTEEIPLGHELITASSYWGTFLWMYLYQGWPITLSIILGSLFIYLIVLALVPYQDIGDIKSDLKSGKKTLTVRLGLDGIGHLCIFLALGSLLVLSLALLVG